MATEYARQDYAHSEGKVAKTIEQQTAKLPSDTFLWMGRWRNDRIGNPAGHG